MTDYRNLIQNLPGAIALVQERDGWWMTAPDLDVLELARRMKEWGARFSTMTGVLQPQEETAVIYHYCLGGVNFNFKVLTKNNHLPSISLILPAAEWIEREIQDLFRVKFVDHPNPMPLVRPIQMEPGFFRQPGGAASKAER